MLRIRKYRNLTSDSGRPRNEADMIRGVDRLPNYMILYEGGDEVECNE